MAFSPEGSGARSGQSGDLQGLSNVQGADSESVDELIEEGNALEADVVTGIEDAGGADEREVRTHEVPQDDVPEEYLDFVSFYNPNQRGRGLVHLFRPVDSVPAGKGIKQEVSRARTKTPRPGSIQ